MQKTCWSAWTKAEAYRLVATFIMPQPKVGSRQKIVKPNSNVGYC